MDAGVVLADEYWAYFHATQQLFNIDRGDVDEVEHWDDFSPEGLAAEVQCLLSFADRAETLARAQPGDAAGGTLAAIAFSGRSTAVGRPWERDRTLVSAPVGLAAVLPTLVPRYVLVTRRHGEGYLAKLAAFPGFVEGWVAGLRDGAAAGRVPTARGVQGTIERFQAMLATDVADDALASQDPPEEAIGAEATVWRGRVQDLISNAVRPAIARLCQFLRDEVVPVSRSDAEPGLCQLPAGEEAYASLLHAATSTKLTADEIHHLGLEQLARLDDEYRSVAGPLLGCDDPAVARERLRDDLSLRYTTAAELVRDAEVVLARAQAASPAWFGRLPVAPCRAVAADAGGLAYYCPPSPDGNRGGIFYFNVSEPSAWGRYQVEVTTFHEGVPGHHLQLALAQELNLHPVHSELPVPSYEEGWGLYAERLADEMGLYGSAMARLGMLASDSLRACRLVVDTGLHARGWSRERAIEFLFDNAAMNHRLVEDEIDRYICWPGQATSYMVGRLTLDRLRADAQARLGSRFDLRDFHDVVLGRGMMALDQLALRVNDWISNTLNDG